MCFDQKTSLITFSVSLLCSTYLYYRGFINKNRNDKLFSIIVILVGLMQLIEFFIWRNQTCYTRDKSCYKRNHFYSLMIIVVLVLQVIIGLNLYCYIYRSDRFISYNIIFIYSICCLIYLIFLLKWLNSDLLYSTTSKGNCRLHWSSLEKISKSNFNYFLFMFLYFFYWIIVLIEIIFGNYREHLNYPIRHLLFPLLSVVAVLYILYLNKNKNILEFIKNPMLFREYVDVWGSVWCFVANALGIIVILNL